MATGIIGSIGPNATITYTAAANAKVIVMGTWNTTSIAAISSNSPFYMGVGQSITLTTLNSQAVTISAIEEI